MKKSALVSGYATMDYAVRAPLAIGGPQTAEVERLGANHWPRAGGAALYASRRIAAAGHRAVALVSLGQDDHAALYREACRAAGVAVLPVECDPQQRTPWCMLLYHDDGTCTCLIERGRREPHDPVRLPPLSLAEIDLVCIGAGEARVSEALLDSLPPEVPLAWIAKRDQVSFPPGLSERLAQRADFIFCNAWERNMIDASRSGGAKTGQTIIETRAGAGVLLERRGATTVIPTGPLQVRDPTGAGDTLAGEVLAALLDDTDLEAAVYRGMQAARALLLERTGPS